METTYSIFFAVLMITGLCYLLVMLVMAIGWSRIKAFRYSQSTDKPIFISLLVAVRNEANRIEYLLDSINQQSYPKDSFELVLVNDHCEDDTMAKVTSYADKADYTITVVHARKQGKKEGLKEGIEACRGNWIITTDGDCQMGSSWLDHMVNYIKTEKPSLLIGPVVYKVGNGLLSKLFALDFMSLVASGAGSAGAGLAFMGNGANLAFHKDVYLRSLGQTHDAAYASGDDVFLIQKTIQFYGGRAVHFIKDPQSIVYTDPPQNLSTFMQQRMRWGSKAKAYKMPWAIVVSLAVFGFNLMLLLLLLSAIIYPWMLLVFVLFCLFKFMIDSLLLGPFCTFSNRRKLLKYIFPFEMVYPIYLVVAAVMALVVPFKWKGRTKQR